MRQFTVVIPHVCILHIVAFIANIFHKWSKKKKNLAWMIGLLCSVYLHQATHMLVNVLRQIIGCIWHLYIFTVLTVWCWCCWMEAFDKKKRPKTIYGNKALTVSHPRRHVTVKTTPNHKYVFTVKTHHTVAPGSIAFSLPQVCACMHAHAQGTQHGMYDVIWAWNRFALSFAEEVGRTLHWPGGGRYTVFVSDCGQWYFPVVHHSTSVFYQT